MNISEEREIKKTVTLTAQDVIDLFNQAYPKNKAPDNATVLVSLATTRDILMPTDKVQLIWMER